MTVKAESLKKQLNEKWLQRLKYKKAANRGVRCGKTAIACKCPKCGELHETFMRWSGRGMPRVYCQNCRPFVAGTCDWQVEMGRALFGRGTRRGSYPLFE